MSESKLRPINPTLLYPAETLAEQQGFGMKTLRRRKHDGLKCHVVGNRLYVFGADWIDFVRSRGTEA